MYNKVKGAIFKLEYGVDIESWINLNQLPQGKSMSL